MFISSPKNQSKVITVYSLSHTQGTYLQRIVNSFVSILPQLASDLIKFYQIKDKVESIAQSYKYINESMGPFIETCSLVLLTLVSQTSKPIITKNFFNRPSILASILDYFAFLDGCISFKKPFLSYFMKKQIEVMAEFNTNLSDIIQQKFSHDLPDLYIPVINKLWFRFMNLWLTATEIEIDEQEEMKHQEIKLADRMVIDKQRLLDEMWRLLHKYKVKCLAFMLSKRVKDIFLEKEKHQSIDGGQRESALEYNNNSEDKKATSEMFKRVAMIHDRSGNTLGLTICMQLLVQTCLVEFHTKGDIQRS